MLKACMLVRLTSSTDNLKIPRCEVKGNGQTASVFSLDSWLSVKIFNSALTLSKKRRFVLQCRDKVSHFTSVSR